MPRKTIQYFLIQDVEQIHHFLQNVFHASSSRLKKYFNKEFLNKSLKKGSCLELPLDFVNDQMINPEYAGPEIKIVYEDDNFLVLDKPINIFVHPLSYSESNNLLSYLRKIKPDVLSVNSDHYDRGLLHRLDFETSGIVIYVKNNQLYTDLREKFSVIAKAKRYQCVVEGECLLSGEFVHYFSSKELKGKRVIVSNDPIGQEGRLTLRPLHYLREKNLSLMEVELKTGLRHQIRAQLAFLGFPLHGDSFYGGRSADRLYLHAQNYQLELGPKLYSFSTDPLDFSGLE